MTPARRLCHWSTPRHAVIATIATYTTTIASIGARLDGPDRRLGIQAIAKIPRPARASRSDVPAAGTSGSSRGLASQRTSPSSRLACARVSNRERADNVGMLLYSRVTSPRGPRSMRRTAAAALAAAGALFLAYASIVQPHARVSALGDRRYAVDEFGRGEVIQQSFDAVSDGLFEIRAQFQAASATRVDVEYQLLERRDSQLIDVGHGRDTVEVTPSAAWHAFPFPPIERSE